ncbi:cell death regulator Aven isoform X2 [Hemicordylus capensis]|uniref:cell death regulator Aven isoform X2 n=1 Tax=Hemicordylus capensis TaxID=884348 RepID=UPI00230459ED|nr:cell death regulator Aven isoform X2 [Hemicordylus capensis]
MTVGAEEKKNWSWRGGGETEAWKATTDLESREEEKEQGSYSRRKVVSNWHRYEGTEKETLNDSGESQRGTDFSVLLSSAGDSFTQFRFAEEKEWTTENICPKQLSGLYVDCQSLVQALEELPLHLKLNVAAELVQDATPVALPQIKSKSKDASKRSAPLQQHVGQSIGVSSCCPATDSAAAAHLMLPNKGGCGIISSEIPQKTLSVTQQETDHLDEDLDLLLKLDNPVNPEKNVSLETISHDTASGEDLKMPYEENVLSELGGTEESCSTSQKEEVTSKNITEEDLEDWLDSMIS